jgi:hypothetical protein
MNIALKRNFSKEKGKERVIQMLQKKHLLAHLFSQQPKSQSRNKFCRNKDMNEKTRGASIMHLYHNGTSVNRKAALENAKCN